MKNFRKNHEKHPRQRSYENLHCNASSLLIYFSEIYETLKKKRKQSQYRIDSPVYNQAQRARTCGTV